MPIDGFQFEEFSKNLAQQASEVVPAEIAPNDKAYIVNLVFNYCMLAGEALVKDETIKIDAQQASIICQLIGEWTFHKAIDVIKSNLPLEVRDETLQKVAFTVFEIAKLAITKNIPIQQIIPLVESHVKKAFDEAIADLTKRGAINQETAKQAVTQSNIDDMAKQQEEAEQEALNQEEPKQEQTEPQEQQTQQSTPTQKKAPVKEEKQSTQKQNRRILKLASLALLMKSFPPSKVNSILKKFNKKDADTIMQYFNMPDLQDKLDSKIAMECLKEIRQNLPQTRSFSADKLNKKLKMLLNNSSEEKISAMLEQERENVKKMIETVRQGTKSTNLPPRIAAVLCSYIEEKSKR